jgi:hypothetical protein
MLELLINELHWLEVRTQGGNRATDSEKSRIAWLKENIAARRIGLARAREEEEEDKQTTQGGASTQQAVPATEPPGPAKLRTPRPK